MISPRGVMWSLKKALDRGEMVGLAADTSNKTTPVHVPFLGVEAATSAMPGLLHLSTGKPIAVCTMERVGRMRFRLHVWDCFTHKATADRDRDLVSICTRINDSLSRAIIARPEQWFWHSRRFRRRPPGEQPRADGLPPFSEGDHPSFWAQGDRPAIQPAPGAGTI